MTIPDDRLHGFVREALAAFVAAQVKGLGELELRRLLRRKNPYYFQSALGRHDEQQDVEVGLEREQVGHAQERHQGPRRRPGPRRWRQTLRCDRRAESA